jgi:hypothetical protein
VNILIAEDNDIKLQSILDFLNDNYLGEITVKNCITPSDSILEIKKKKYDFFILDMSLPVYVGEKQTIRSLSGKNVLLTMKHKRIKTKTVIITQWDVFGHHDEHVSLEKLTSTLLIDFSDFLLDVIFWDSSNNEWKEKLLNLIKGLEND